MTGDPAAAAAPAGGRPVRRELPVGARLAAFAVALGLAVGLGAGIGACAGPIGDDTPTTDTHPPHMDEPGHD